MKTLEDLIAVQYVFNDELQLRKYERSIEAMTADERRAALKEIVFGAVEELLEFSKECSWKMHQRHREANRAKLVEEFVDALKYLLTLPVYAGIAVDEILAEFERKTVVVYDRLRAEYPADGGASSSSR